MGSNISQLYHCEPVVQLVILQMSYLFGFCAYHVPSCVRMDVCRAARVRSTFELPGPVSRGP